MLTALSFLTVFGGSGTPTSRSLLAFPLVGALIGAAVGAGLWGGGLLWPPFVAAGVAVALDAAITGLLHFDGLSDAADGLLAPMDRSRRLAAMRDPAVGAFGAVTVVIVLLLRFASLAAMWSSPRLILTVAALWCASRTAMAVTATAMPYARTNGGLATAFLAGVTPATRVVPLGIGIVLAGGLAVVGGGVTSLIPVAVVGAAAALVALLARVRLGGFTGDVLGAAGVVGETAGLLALAAL